MSTAKAIVNFSNTAVIIDDGFLPPKLEMITDENWGELRQNGDPDAWARISSHFGELKSPSELKRNSKALNDAWIVYESDPDKFSLLNPIFSAVLASRKSSILPLVPIIDFLEGEMKMTLLRHPDIASAKEDIKKCKLVFLDFYLYQAAPEKIVDDIKSFGALFSEPIISTDGEHSRFVFLISTALPDTSILERFRATTKLKSAFFKPVDKSQLSKEWLLRELGARIARYEDMRSLTNYLDSFSSEILQVADSLRGAIESIELFDLAVLDSMRLQKESENLGEYLTWLFSEALAAKIRSSTVLLAAASKVNKIQTTPFHGTLAPKPVLFDLYSDIAFSVKSSENSAQKTQFGDVYAIRRSGGNRYSFGKVTQPQSQPRMSQSAFDLPSVTNREFEPTRRINFVLPKTADCAETNSRDFGDDMLLVISPACDLQRCAIDFEVTCVKGKIVKRAPNLADLFGQKSVFGIDDEVPVLKHLMREKINGTSHYSLVEWNPKRVVSVPLAKLRNDLDYFRCAKLNELFSHEVKEEALRRLGRVGVPVDPSFSAPLGAALRIKQGKNDVKDYPAPDNSFVSGIFLVGNEQNPARIILSEEFLTWLQNTIAELVKKVVLTDKIIGSLQKIQIQGAAGLKLGKGDELSLDGGFKVCYKADYANSKDKNLMQQLDYAIVFYPRPESPRLP